MIDIGIVYYRMSPTGDGFEATWYSSRLDEKATGTGIARGNTSNGFAGTFLITYFNPDGQETGTFDLKIEKNGPIYDLSYIQNGEVLLVGVGIETSDGLAAGYRKLGHP